MEKKKKNKVILNLLATVATVSALLGTFATFASASDVQSDPYDVLVPSIPLESISHSYISNFGTSNLFSGVYENPFVFYDHELNTGRRGKSGVVLNYPYQSGAFTDVGRTIYYEFDVYRQNGVKQADITIPLTYADGRSSRNPFNAARSTLYFNDFIIDIDSDSLFYIYNSASGASEVDPTYYDVSFSLVAPSDDNSSYQTISISDRVYSDELYLSSIYFDDLCASYLTGDYTSFYICDLQVEFSPFNGVVPTTNNGLSVGTTYMTFTLTDEGASSEDIRDWIAANPIIQKEFIGIGDVSVMDWVSVAVGGFFDFEIMPNVTLGGIGLVFVGVALFMLFIRIYRG